MATSTKHHCNLKSDGGTLGAVIDTGLFIDFRRKFRKYFMISRIHPHTNMYIKSIQQVRNQEIRHLVGHYFMIHPFSLFNLHWTYIMTFVFWVYYIIIPFHMGLPVSKYGDTRWILMVCQIFHILHVIACFFTGYRHKSGNLIVMNPKTVAKKYVSTYFFPELLSIVPVILTDIRIYHLRPHQFFKALPFLLYLKLVRIGTWLEYLALVKHYSGFSDNTFTIFKMIMAFICTIFWVYSLLWYSGFDRWARTYGKFLIEFEKATEMILVIEAKLTKDSGRIVVAIVTICFGFIFQLVIYVWVSQIWTKFNSAASKQHDFYRELDAYMSYKELPMTKRERIKMYFDFKFQKNYFKESAMRNLMSDRLNQEMMLAVAKSSVTKVDLFKNLPDAILRRFSRYLASEVYLPGDVIIRSGTIGDAMYFILVGTVGVTTPEGKHICFLRDGATFGEISLILHLRRVANVVAIAPCEILRLNRNNFLNAFKNCSSELNLLKEVANSRLADLKTIQTAVFEAKANTPLDCTDDKMSKDWIRATFTKSEEELLNEELTQTTR